MKNIFTALIALLFTGTLSAQNITGNWYGSMIANGNKLPIVFHITQNGSSYITQWDSPAQNATNMPTDKTTFTNPNLVIDMSQFGIMYKAVYIPDSNKFRGTFSQSGMNMPLVLTRSTTDVAAAMQARRPQDPKDYPYVREEITFTTPKGGNKLAGTLTMPVTGKAAKIAILISGSGPQNRDEELFNHRPFLVLSDYLTRQGFAVLRYDDRGVGKSTGSFSTSTTADFADDAEAAVNYIKSRSDLKSAVIGLIGHSEGGIIAPMVASRNSQVKFMVLLASPGVPIDQLMLRQNADAARLAGASEEAIKADQTLKQMVFASVKQNSNLSDAAFKTQLNNQTMEYLRKMGANAGTATNTAKQMADPLSTPWFRYFLNIVPANYLTRVKCPTLALNGTLDMQVNSDANLAAIKESLEKAGNKNFVVVPVAGLNHLMQKATTGSVAEYPNIDETINSAVLQKISAWMEAL